MSIKIGINGFGRIGRIFFRAAMAFKDIEIVAINDLMKADIMGHLLVYDSVHGKFNANVSTCKQNDENFLVVNNKNIKIFSKSKPEEIPWKDLGVDIVIESTGLFTDADKAAKHFVGGAKKVIISAPAKGADITIVIGVNSDKYEPNKHNIISNASCTTNCLAPIVKVLRDNFGVKRGLMTTIHSYTGDQRLLDFPHNDLRRARAAALSMIPTSTGAAKAVGLVIPELNGKLNGMAIRVPTPNVSVVDFVADIEKSGVSVKDINEALKKASEENLKNILGYCELPLVSSDFNGTTLSSIVDAPNTFVIDNMVKVLSWYDNEMGYSTRLAELAVMIGAKL